MTQRNSARAAATTLLVGAAALLAACTGPQPGPSPSTASAPTTAASTPQTTPTPTLDPAVEAAKAAVLAAYQEYWDVKVAAFADPSVNPGAELERVAIDTAFTDITTALHLYRSHGIELVGAPLLAPEVAGVENGDEATATIVDCVDSSDWTPQYVKTGDSAQVPGAASRVVTRSTAVIYAGHWTIRTSVADREATC